MESIKMIAVIQVMAGGLQRWLYVEMLSYNTVLIIPVK